MPTPEADRDDLDLPADNPFAEASTLPFGLPPFADVHADHFLPALRAGMADQLREVAAITDCVEAPTIENTLDALERSGDLLNRVSATFHNLVISDSTPALQDIEATIAPELSAHDDAIHLDPALFARIDLLHAQLDHLDLTPEQAHLVRRYHTDFVRAGAALGTEQQDRLRQINERLSVLGAAFNTALLAEAADSAVAVQDPDELVGLSSGRIASAREAAATRGLDGYLLTLSLPTPQPVLEHLADRDLRRRLHEASTRRGSRGNAHDVRALVVEVVQLRAERAELFGYPNHAAYVVADETAGDTAAVNAMLDRLVGPAMRNADAEAEALGVQLAQDETARHDTSHDDTGQDGTTLDSNRIDLQPWDWLYYAARDKAASFDVDEDGLRDYFELSRVVHDGVFHAMHVLYGVTFERRTDLTGYHPDVEIYEVRDGDGSALGLLLTDWYARDSKKGGAWMSSFATQARLVDRRPVIVINLNVPKPAPGDPALMTLDEVVTAFHEFGHVMHGLLSDVTYPRFSGTWVPRDFVEFPSQVNEMWAFHPQVLPHYARHRETGEPLDPQIVERLQAAQRHGQGFATTEYLGATLLDQEWHRLSHAEALALTADDVEDYESQALARRGIDHALVSPRYRTTYFAHIFGGGYAAAYYAYIWSEVLDADTVDWFGEHGGLTAENGRRFRDEILAPGGSRDPLESFRRLRGRDADVQPLLKRRGLDGA